MPEVAQCEKVFDGSSIVAALIKILSHGIIKHS